MVMRASSASEGGQGGARTRHLHCFEVPSVCQAMSSGIPRRLRWGKPRKVRRFYAPTRVAAHLAQDTRHDKLTRTCQAHLHALTQSGAYLV